MAYRHRGISVEKEFRHRQSDNLASSDDHSPLSLDFHAGFFQHPDDAFRRARYGARLFHPERRHVERVEAVHVLVFRNGGNDFVFVNVFRQRQLNEDSVHSVIRIQFRNEFQQFRFRNVRRLQYRGVLYSHHFRCLGLAFHI